MPHDRLYHQEHISRIIPILPDMFAYSVVPQTGQKWLFFACLDLLGCVSGGNYFPLSSSGANYSILAILVFWLHSMTFWGGVVAIPMPMPKCPIVCLKRDKLENEAISLKLIDISWKKKI